MRSGRSTTMLVAVLAALGALLTLVDQFQPVSDGDFFWHLKTGEWIWQHRALPAEDPFAYTSPRALDTMQRFTLTSYWLGQTTFHLLHRAGGFPAIVLLKFLLVGLLVLALLPRSRGDRPVFAGVLLLGLVVLGVFSFERPQAFSLVLYAALLALLERLRRAPPAGRRGLLTAAAVPLVMLVWANVHGAHLLGQATILLFLATEGVASLSRLPGAAPPAARRRLLAAGLLGLAFSLLNPNTYHAVEYLRASAPNPLFVNIEYQSTLFAFTRLNLYRIAVFWALLLLALWGAVARRREPDLAMFALLAGLGGVAFFKSRYVPFFVVAAVPAVASWLSGAGALKWSRPVVVFLAAASAAHFGWADRSALIEPGSGVWVDRNLPEKEADFIIRQGLGGNLYNNPNWGGYLIWRLGPQRKVFSDGRSLEPRSFLSTGTIDNALAGPGPGGPAWKRLLEEHDVQYVLTPLFGRGVLYPLVGALLRDPEWGLVFAGYNSLIFLRASPQNSGVLRAWSLPKDRYLDDMIAWYTRQAAREPGKAFLHLARGELLLGRGRLAEARAAYAKVLELAPFNLVARERLRAVPPLTAPPGPPGAGRP